MPLIDYEKVKVLGKGSFGKVYIVSFIASIGIFGEA